MSYTLGAFFDKKVTVSALPFGFMDMYSRGSVSPLRVKKISVVKQRGVHMCICVHDTLPARVCICVCVCVCVHVHAWTHVFVCMCVCVCAHACASVCKRVICMCAHLHACVSALSKHVCAYRTNA